MIKHDTLFCVGVVISIQALKCCHPTSEEAICRAAADEGGRHQTRT